MNVFEDLKLSPELLLAIKKLGFTKPTQIQGDSIPLILQGKDIVGESATGSGKTLAFGCGIIDHVDHGKGLQALILTPTRELAEQVKDALRRFAHHKHLNITAVYGGVSIGPQINALTKADVAVATPGRLLDHLERGTIDTSKVKLLVLDEADRMLDMGFIEDVERIIQACPRNRQTLFFSATISPRIKELANKYMKEPTQVMATKMVDPTKLEQVYYDVQRNVKLSLLAHLLQAESAGLIMVFCNTRKTTEFVAKTLKANKIKAISIHGGLTQNKRSKNIELFNGAKIGVLVCTDVAARGLHISNVSHVYNYDIPKDSNDYVHRIGRTARAGESGKVINLLCDYDHENFGRIQHEFREFKIQKLEKPELPRIIIARTEQPRFGGNKGRSRGGFGVRLQGPPGQRPRSRRSSPKSFGVKLGARSQGSRHSSSKPRSAGSPGTRTHGGGSHGTHGARPQRRGPPKR